MVEVEIEPADACILCMVCVAVCPEVFRIKGDKILVAGAPWRGTVEDRLEPCVKAAAENCPVDIIRFRSA